MTYAFLKYEDEFKMRASLVLDYYKLEVLSIQDSGLSIADVERKKKVLKLIDYLSSLKIIDASVLIKLYNIYRYKV